MSPNIVFPSNHGAPLLTSFLGRLRRQVYARNPRVRLRGAPWQFEHRHLFVCMIKHDFYGGTGL
jgi:hypothetical protein